MAVARGHSYNLRPRSKDGRAAGSRAECAVVEEDTTPTTSRSETKPGRSSTAVQETPLSELNLPLELKWRRVSDMPFGIGHSPRAVVINGNVYIGGGVPTTSVQDAATVCEYNPSGDSWRRLSPYGYLDFALTVINEKQLVAVGGKDIQSEYYEATNKLGVWDEKQRQWVFSLPAMNTACSSPAAATYNQWLLVAGGEAGRDRLSRVEVLNVSSQQWYQVSPLPVTWYRVSSTIIGNTWYLMGGWANCKPTKSVMSICVEHIISEAISNVSQQQADSNESPTTSKWTSLPDPVPVESSMALGFQGALLAVGGGDYMYTSSTIYVYQPSTSKWTLVGCMPAVRHSPACAVLPNGDILVATGIGGEKSVDIGQVM